MLISMIKISSRKKELMKTKTTNGRVRCLLYHQRWAIFLVGNSKADRISNLAKK